MSPTLAYALSAGNLLLKGDPSIPVAVSPENRAANSRKTAKLSGRILAYHLPYVTDVSLRIRDAAGKTVWKYRRPAAPGDHSLSLPLHGLAPGRYVLDFRAGGVRQTFAIAAP
jgi:hypothetical protein